MALTTRHGACTEHAPCRDYRVAPFPPGRVVKAGDALRALGLRATIHPIDTVAYLHTDRLTAIRAAAIDRDHYGHDTHLLPAEGGTIVVTDFRRCLADLDVAAADPALPDRSQ